MKKNRLIINCFVALLAVVYSGILILENVAVIPATVATIEGSYADTYADKHNLIQVNLSDSNEEYFDQRYELFEYNVDDGHIILEQYDGMSKELVIPSEIEGMLVKEIGATFFDNLKNVESVYLPISVEEIKADPVDDITLYCNSDCEFYQGNQESEWKIEVTSDSEFVNLFLGDLEFEYNDNGKNIEITQYTGEYTDVLVVPSYINGKPVSEVSMDLVGIAEVVVIPETVTSISGETVVHLYSNVFVIELIFTIVAMLAALIVVNVILPRYKKKEEFLLNGPQMVVTVLYLLMQCAFSIASIYFVVISPYLALVLSAVMLILYLVVVFAAETGRTHVKQIEQKVIEKTDRMKAIKASARNLASDIEDKEARKQVERLEEEIRYSDPVTNDELDAIEMKIEDGIKVLKQAISLNDVEQITTNTIELHKMVQERNVMCEKYK